MVPDCVQRAQEDATYPKLHLFVHFTREAEENVPTDEGFYHGRADLPALFNRIAVERAHSLTNQRGAVFVCGPTPLVNATWDAALSASSTHDVNLLVHTETFDF